MLPIDVLIRSAVNDGAYFEVVDHNVVVHGASLIDEDVRQALKARRDELHLQLQSNNANTAPAGLLRSSAVSAVFIDDDTTARRMIKGLLNDLKDGFVAIDFETHAINTDSDTKAAKRSALNPLKANVRLIQIYGGGGSCLVMDMQHVRWSSLGALWDQRLVFHNAQFELSFLRHRNIEPSYFECTMQAAGLLLGVSRRSLSSAANAYLGWELDKTFQSVDWGQENLPQTWIDYAALDAVAAFRLWKSLEGELHSKQRWEAYAIQRDAIPAAVEMTVSGISVDTKEHSDFVERWNADLSQARRKWIDNTGQDIPSTRADLEAFLNSVMGDEEIALWPKTEKTGQLSTSSDALEKAIHVPGINQLLHIRHLEKLINTFGDSLAQWFETSDGRIHPNYNVAATKSGRWTCNRPNLQQIPSDRLSKGFRKIFTAPKGRSLIGADYSQME